MYDTPKYLAKIKGFVTFVRCTVICGVLKLVKSNVKDSDLNTRFQCESKKKLLSQFVYFFNQLLQNSVPINCSS